MHPDTRVVTCECLEGALSAGDYRIEIDKGFKFIFSDRTVLDEIERIKSQASGVNRLILATASDDSGEALAYCLASFLGTDLRAVVPELTQETILCALSSPTTLSRSGSHALLIRTALNNAVKLRVFPDFEKSLSDREACNFDELVLLHLLCEHDKKVARPASSGSYVIRARFKFRQKTFTAILKSKDIHIPDVPHLHALLFDLKKQKFIIRKVRRKNVQVDPPPPFTLDSLLRESFRRFGMTIETTRALLRQLQEGIAAEHGKPRGFVTYPVLALNDRLLSGVRELICNDYGVDYLPAEPRRFADVKGMILPTEPLQIARKRKRYLTKNQYRLYELICSRFFASQMAAAEWRQTEVEVEGGPNRRYQFHAGQTEVMRRGFMQIDQTCQKVTETEIPDELSPFNEVILADIEPSRIESPEPGRLSQSDVLDLLEQRRLSIAFLSGLSSLARKGYLDLHGPYVVPTSRGQTVDEMVRRCYPRLHDLPTIRRFDNDVEEIKKGTKRYHQVIVWLTDMLASDGKKSAEDLRMVRTISEPVPAGKCERCGRDLVVKEGKFGRFLACPGFPKCSFTKPYSLKIRCPVPGCEGEIIERCSKSGKIFYGCSSYPACKFSTWEITDDVIYQH